LKHLDSPSGNTRARTFMLTRRVVEQGTSPETFLEVAGRHLADPDFIVRYEAGIVASEALPSHAEEVWRHFLQALPRVGADSRCDLGCLLLEHLLDVDSRDYFMRCRQEVSENNFLVLDALEMCWFDDFGPQWDAAQSFAFEARQQLKRDRGAD